MLRVAAEEACVPVEEYEGQTVIEKRKSTLLVEAAKQENVPLDDNYQGPKMLYSTARQKVATKLSNAMNQLANTAGVT